ncbi:cell division protein FtsL [Sodalis endosymbiont of Henestaris halophilus]|uniref:cell division protein FtsL n=1 Tax=Sodalis endosymbiont of Henestaris halophilus TaxID=1929246 RepID=UPI000BBF836B|nr:cell division protein FtsL [Sodalis endosymbiont of Henestaris halophilus]SNC58980.1 Cell division protein FtsL [Sodalis endosymbiont of Henestaris halophilus]
MIGNKRHSLIGIIGSDLLRYGKLPLLLLVTVLVSAILVVMTTHQTRRLTAKREHMVIENHALDIEWRNLILEEKALGHHSRIERIAIENMQLKHVDLSQENLMVHP